MCLAVLQGRGAVHLFEFIREIIRIVEAAVIGDSGYAHLFIALEKLLGVLKSHQRQILVKAEARVLLEGSGKMLLADKVILCHLRKIYLLAEVLLHVGNHVLDHIISAPVFLSDALRSRKGIEYHRNDILYYLAGVGVGVVHLLIKLLIKIIELLVYGHISVEIEHRREGAFDRVGHHIFRAFDKDSRMLSAEIIGLMNNAAWYKHNVALHHLVNLVVNEIIAGAVHHIVDLVEVVIMVRVHHVAVVGGDIHSEPCVVGKFEYCHSKPRLCRFWGRIRSFFIRFYIS